jgi:N-acyl-D-amino-acid deacylase
MTGLTAHNFGLAERGRIAEGMAADLVVFDAQRVIDTATYEDPKRAAAGIETVLVNGVPVWAQGCGTGARPGRVLTRAGAKQT